MIVVNLNKSYPAVAAALVDDHPNSTKLKVTDLQPLADITRGDWYRLSEAKIAETGDLIIGTYASQVVSAYEPTGHIQNADGTVTFTVRPARHWAALIGAPQPCGPWKRGEARGTRYLPTEDYQGYYSPNPDLRTWRIDTHQVAGDHARRMTRDDTAPTQTTSPAAISVSWPDGPTITLAWAAGGVADITLPTNLPYRIHRDQPGD